MGYGYIQIVAIDEPNLYFIHDPQITFFKSTVRRNANFSIEPVEQPFNVPPNFGDKVSCDVSRNVGDLLHRAYLVVDLPDVVGAAGLQYAWRRNVGYELIDFVELEVNGRVVDRLHGDWLQLVEELESDVDFKKLGKLVGDVPELYEFSATKRGRRVYVPLRFWFAQVFGRALPLVALQYSEVKLYVQFKPLSEVLFVSPTHEVAVEEFVSLFEAGELLRQVLPDGTEVFGRFVSFDSRARRVRYNPLYQGTFVAGPLLVGAQSVFSMTPVERDGAASRATGAALPALSIRGAHVLCNFVQLGNAQRLAFAKGRHEFLVQQLQVFRENSVVNRTRRFKINFNHPCSTLVLCAKLAGARGNTTYTTFERDGYSDVSTRSLIEAASLSVNGKPYLTEAAGDIYNKLNKVAFYGKRGRNGVLVIVLDLHPLRKEQPSGSINFSVNAAVELEVTFDRTVSADNPAHFSCFALNYNVFHVENGIGEIKFLN